MAFYTATHSADAGFAARITARAADLLAAASREIARRRMIRVTYNELASLPDRELADLGLTRSELRFVARQAAQKAL